MEFLYKLCDPAHATDGAMAPLLECFLCSPPLPQPCTSAAVSEEDTCSIEQEHAEEEGKPGFEDAESIRQHLIADHAQQVASAFFYPNASDTLHIWLMSCVDFARNPPDASPVQNILDDDLQVAEEASESPLDLEEVLSVLLQNNTDAPSDYEKSETRKRGISTFGNEPPAKKNLKDNAENILLDQERQSPTATSHPGLVDSKAKNKVMCQICRIEVCNTARQRHVFMVHVKENDMYKCPQCDYVNSNSIWEAKKHTAQHGKGVEPISNEDKYKTAIMTWNRKCFPEWKQKRPSWWTGNEEESSVETDDCTELIRAQIIRNSPPPKNNKTNLELLLLQLAAGGNEEFFSIVKDEDRNDVPPRPAPDGIVVDERTCNLCWEESRYPGRHIAQKHLKRPLYECPVCKNFGSYESCTVMKHIHKMHPEDTEAQPINNLDLYAEEIRDLQNRCFPNRPMKLVRSRDSTRPRERHNCMVCGAQVAQSDRQRHVYHKHLQANRIFECPLCNFSSNYDVHRVKWHIKWMHKDESNLEPISHENDHRKEIDALNEKCFPGWQHRRRPFWWLDQGEKGHDIKVEESESIDGSDICKEEEEGSLVDVKEEIMDDVDSSKLSATLTKRLSEWTCRLCFKEFKPTSNFLRHVAKDHLDMPLYACPLCDEGSSESFEVKAHLVKVHEAAHLEPISNLEQHPEHVQQRFQECFPNRKMKPGLFDKKKESSAVEDCKVTCQECFQEMKTEDRQIHVYRHHLKEPRLYECPLCDFAHHACSSDVRAHIKYTHREQPDLMPKANLLEHSTAIAEWNERCFPGWINRKLPASIMEDFNRCRLCDEEVRQTSRHIAEVHLKIQLHVCPLCDYGAPESRLVKRHIKNHHDDGDMEPIANVVARRADFSALHDKCFPGRPKRLSNITISDEGRRTKCKLCSAAVSRKKRLSHTLEKHLSRTGYGCSNCDFTHDWDENIVINHIKAAHGNGVKAKVLCLAGDFFSEVQDVGLTCFPDWVMDVRQFE